MKEISRANLSTASEIKRDSPHDKVATNASLFIPLSFLYPNFFFRLFCHHLLLGMVWCLIRRQRAFWLFAGRVWLLGALLSVLDTSRTSDHRAVR